MRKALARFLCVSLVAATVFLGNVHSSEAAGKVTIASFDVSYSNLYDTDTDTKYINSKDPKTVVAGGKLSLDLADKYGSKESGYKFTSGKGTLYATLNGTGRRKLEWSGDKDLFKDGGAKVMAPVMTAGSNNQWNVNSLPYFEVVLDTTGYEDITFSASIGATKKGPKSYRMAYRVGSSGSFTDIKDSGAFVTLSDNKAYTKINGALPSSAKNQKQVTVKIYATSSATIGGDALSVNPTGGKIAINHILVQGSKVSTVQPKPTANSTPKPKSTAQSTSKPSQTNAPSSNGGQSVKLGKAVISKAKYNAGKKKLTVTVKKNAKAAGYQVKVGTNNKVTKSVKTVTITGTKTVINWKSKKCFVKVRAYTTKSNGGKAYGKWSAVKKVK